MFAISIITKPSWIVLPFQNAEIGGEQMYDARMPSHQQGRHTNVLKTYDVAPANHFLLQDDQMIHTFKELQSWQKLHMNGTRKESRLASVLTRNVEGFEQLDFNFPSLTGSARIITFFILHKYDFKTETLVCF